MYPIQTITERGDDSIKLYFKEVSKIPLLSSNEESELLSRAKNGDKKAIDKLVTHNLRFVITIAKQYQGKGTPLVDLIQFGNIGLIEGARRFDPDRNVKFITYAVWWIRQSIVKNLSSTCKTVRLPSSQITSSRCINKVRDYYLSKYGRLPTQEELEEETGFDVDKLNYVMSGNSKSISIDAPFNEDCTLLDIIPGDNEEPNYDIDIVRKLLYEALNKLPDRERDIIMLKFGFGVRKMTLYMIADKFGIGYERVRQILRHGLTLLRKERNKMAELYDIFSKQ